MGGEGAGGVGGDGGLGVGPSTQVVAKHFMRPESSTCLHTNPSQQPSQAVQDSHSLKQGGGPDTGDFVGDLETVGLAVVGEIMGLGEIVGACVPSGNTSTSAQL